MYCYIDSETNEVLCASRSYFTYCEKVGYMTRIGRTYFLMGRTFVFLSIGLKEVIDTNKILKIDLKNKYEDEYLRNSQY